MTDGPPLSPELVLVSPPELAARARAALTPPSFAPPAPRQRPSDPRRGEIAAVYAASLAFTLVPLTLALLAVPARP